MDNPMNNQLRSTIIGFYALVALLVTSAIIIYVKWHRKLRKDRIG